MKPKVLIISLLVVIVLTALCIVFEQYHPVKHSPAVTTPNVAATIPAPPPLPPPVSRFSQTSILNRAPVSTSFTKEAEFSYDDKLSFADNLERLKAFCSTHANDPQLQKLLDRFVRALFAHSKEQFSIIKGVLEHLDGPETYRNIVLDCLIATDAPMSAKADLVWAIALDQTEPLETRRLAVHLTAQFLDEKRRPQEFLSLLKDSDSDIVILALKTASVQMDNNSYNFIKTTLLNSSDVNVRIAAVDAIGTSASTQTQSELLSIINNLPTSQTTTFSDPSLVKRRAISHLDVSMPDNQALIERLVLDDNEDPSVRAEAITKYTPEEFPESTTVLLKLMQSLSSNDAIILASIEDNLLASPTPKIIQAIRTKADELSDPQLRNFMIQRLEKKITGGNP